MRKCRYGIFDMDGTLLDSMSAWRDLGKNYLKNQGISIPQNLEEVLRTQTLEESAAWFIEELGVQGSMDEVVSGINSLIEEEYFFRIPLKKGVREYLKCCKAEGMRICVATSTPAYLAEAALKRLGIFDLFAFIIDCKEAGAGKTKPDIYYQAVKRLGGSVQETAVYEDALFAMETAKKAGFYTVGIYDAGTKETSEQAAAMCDWYIRDYEKDIYKR